MDIRIANKDDYNQIYDLVKLAFKTAQVSDGTEQDFVLKLRAGQSYIPELEFVALEDDEIIAHIMFTKQIIKLEDKEIIALLVAPLCVKLEQRNKKVGAKLMEYGLKEAKGMGYKAAFLIGNPEYYKKLGYKQSSLFGITATNEIPEQYVLVYEIEEGALNNIHGTIEVAE